MSEIAELETRIMSAMERIGRAVDQKSVTAGHSPEELEDAQSAAQAAEDRTRAAMDRAQSAEAELEKLQLTIEAEATAGAQLRDRVGALQSMKEQQQGRIAELETEMDALQARRSEDRAELDELVAALGPLVKETPDA